MPSTAARPRPRPVNLVVKNGSKIRGLRLGVHAAARVGDLAGRRRRPARGRSPNGTSSQVLARRRCGAGRARGSCPAASPSASEAFVIRFMTTCRIWLASASTAGRSVVEVELQRRPSSRSQLRAGRSSPCTICVQVERLDDEPTLARVGQHLVASARRRARRRRVDLLDVAGGRACRGDLRSQRQVRVAEDAHQEVVEVVGDAAGQHAQALESLRLLHLAFELPRSSVAISRSVTSMATPKAPTTSPSSVEAGHVVRVETRSPTGSAPARPRPQGAADAVSSAAGRRCTPRRRTGRRPRPVAGQGSQRAPFRECEATLRDRGPQDDRRVVDHRPQVLLALAQRPLRLFTDVMSCTTVSTPSTRPRRPSGW